MTEEIIWSRKPFYHPINCNKCSTIIEFIPPLSIPQQLKVRCYKCQAINTIEKEHILDFGGAKSQFPSTSSTNGTLPWGNINTGTNENPLSTQFYDLLKVSPTATQDDIKKKYYDFALNYHTNKDSGPDAKEKFKKISEAYLILRDEKLRHKYNELGSNSITAPEGDFARLELLIKQCFIGERFVEIIGEIRITRDIRNALINGKEENKIQLSPEETILKNKIDSEQRECEFNERVSALASNLINKMSFYTEHESRDSEEKFRQKIICEIEELKYENLGVEIIHTVGNIYSLKAKRYLDSQKSYRIFNFAKETGHFFSDTNSKFSDICFVVKLETQILKTNNSLDEADKNGICQSEKDQLKQEYSTKYLNYLWQHSRLEVTCVIRQVCDRILGDTIIPKSILMSRARGLKIIGDLYLACESV